MSVTLTWSSTIGGAALTDPLDHGSKNNGEATEAQEVFLHHNGGSSITGVKLFIRQYSGTYGGSVSAAADFTEILEWGDATDQDEFGGVQINMDSVNEYPDAQWPNVSSKTPSRGFVCLTGTADNETNAVLLSKYTHNSNGTDGVLPASTSARFKMRVQVPTDEDTIGIRQFDLVALYTYTS